MYRKTEFNPNKILERLSKLSILFAKFCNVNTKTLTVLYTITPIVIYTYFKLLLKELYKCTIAKAKIGNPQTKTSIG